MSNIFLDGCNGNILLVDPVSPEVNRGSFCYLSYLFYSALKKQEKGVELLEEFAIADFDDIMWEAADHIYIALWSYPQIEACLMLHKLLKGRAKFYGYYPIIEALGLPMVYASNDLLVEGMINYPSCFDDFNYLLLSDCDKHLVDNSEQAENIDKRVFPLFTSYGCPQGCKFCPATANCHKIRSVVPLDDVYNMLKYLHAYGRVQIHFTDEDFFFDTKRAVAILKYAATKTHFKFIALGTVQKVHDFIEYVGTLPTEEAHAIWSTLSLIEIGLETAEPTLASQMGKRNKKGQDKAVFIAEFCPVPVLWLTMTFYPGDNIYSINQTGRFMQQYGLLAHTLVDRIATNGTWAGLGQFFQFYPGTGMSPIRYRREGIVCSERPMRLIPSYIPYSFLKSQFTIDLDLWKSLQQEINFWMTKYSIQIPELLHKAIEKAKLFPTSIFNVGDFVHTENENGNLYVPFTNTCLAIAILARLNVIKAA